jgi:hypothetical protein
VPCCACIQNAAQQTSLSLSSLCLLSICLTLHSAINTKQSYTLSTTYNVRLTGACVQCCGAPVYVLQLADMSLYCCLTYYLLAALYTASTPSELTLRTLVPLLSHTRYFLLL